VFKEFQYARQVVATEDKFWGQPQFKLFSDQQGMTFAVGRFKERAKSSLKQRPDAQTGVIIFVFTNLGLQEYYTPLIWRIGS
jgi:hypothetical protein